MDYREATTIVVQGRATDRVRVGEERAPAESPCPGCGAYYFDTHEAGCDYEECPACGGSLVACGCDQTGG